MVVSVVVVICGEEYPTISAAAAALNLSSEVIRRRLDSPLERWKDWTRKGQTKPQTRSRASREVIIDGIRYASVSRAAQTLGLTFNTVYGRCESTLDHFANYQFADPEPTRHSPRVNGVAVMVYGQRYKTLLSAAQANGVCSMTLSRKMHCPRHPDHYYIDTRTGQPLPKGRPYEKHHRSATGASTTSITEEISPPPQTDSKPATT